MKIIIKILLVAVFAISNTYGQDFQGVATYKTHRNIDIKMDSTKMTSDMQKQMQEMMKRQFQKTYNLSFNKEASIYKEEESLATPQVGNSSGMQIMVVGSGGGSDVLYKNTKENRFTDQKDTMGKLFLVKDEMEKIDWKLENENKFIGEYQCFKATYTKMVPKPMEMSSFSVNEEKDNKEVLKPEMIERTVTAWYTPQVSVNSGPAMYQGLPGLILEIHDGKLSIVCSKIVLNPEKELNIEEPTKGKEINQAEYDEIMEKKNKEMMERYAPRKGSRSGEHFEIRIGG